MSLLFLCGFSASWLRHGTSLHPASLVIQVACFNFLHESPPLLDVVDILKIEQQDVYYSQLLVLNTISTCRECLEAIKKIRKARGATRKMRLVSVAEDDDPMESHQERSPTVEQEPLQFQLDDASPMSAMENAVSRGVEAALRHIFIDKGLPMSTKHSP
ncbi:hypothetical protein F4604DRAFT_1685748 [Suillus subluteus]|nr:hypothetical protein F4604DRAFT_1685748 [Suillus subluteus]